MDRLSNIQFRTSFSEATTSALEKAAEKGNYLDVETVGGKRQFVVRKQSWLHGEFGSVSQKALELLQLEAMSRHSEVIGRAVNLPPDRFKKIEDVFQKLASKMFYGTAESQNQLLSVAVNLRVSGRKENELRSLTLRSPVKKEDQEGCQSPQAHDHLIDYDLFNKIDAPRQDMTLAGKPVKGGRRENSVAVQNYLAGQGIKPQQQSMLCALMTQHIALTCISEDIGPETTSELAGINIFIKGNKNRSVDCKVDQERQEVIITQIQGLDMTVVEEVEPLRQATLKITLRVKLADLDKDPLPFERTFMRTPFVELPLEYTKA